MSFLIEFNEMKQEEESRKVKNNRPKRLAHFSSWIPSLALVLDEVRSASRIHSKTILVPRLDPDKSCMTLGPIKGRRRKGIRSEPSLLYKAAGNGIL